MNNESPGLNAYAPLVLRLSLAFIFLYHGVQKIDASTDWGASWALKEWRNPKDLMPESLQSAAAQYAVAWGEVLGGAALLLGLLTRLSGLGLIIIQLGAIYTVTAARGFSFAQGGGYEYNVALIGMCLALALSGAGPFSLDHCLREMRKKSSAASQSAATTSPQPAPGQGATAR
jgi:putative oxidoreductase